MVSIDTRSLSNKKEYTYLGFAWLAYVCMHGPLSVNPVDTEFTNPVRTHIGLHPSHPMAKTIIF